MRFLILFSSIALILGCGGLRTSADAAIRQEARTKFISACTRAGPPGATQPVCTCAADELLRTHTTKQLLALAANPSAKELVPVVAECARKLVR